MFEGKREIKPTGWRIPIKPDVLEEVTRSGIVLARDDNLHRSAINIGTITHIGPQAWKDYKTGEAWAVVGDRVLFSKYAGAMVEDGSEAGLVLCNDEDIQAIIESKNRANAGTSVPAKGLYLTKVLYPKTF